MERGQDKIYETLRQRLVGGRYPPGAALREEGLSQEFGLSRSPVRAALKRLVADGLVTTHPGRGIQVAEWSDQDVEETFRLRMLLEPHAAELACQRGGSALTAQLHRSNERMAAAIQQGGERGVADVQEANRDFHRALLDHAGSPRLRAILDTMIDMPIIVRSFYLATNEELDQSLRHHLDITLAADRGDGELGKSAMQLHLHMAHRRFMRNRLRLQSTL